jgi:hypothetical protein
MNSEEDHDVDESNYEYSDEEDIEYSVDAFDGEDEDEIQLTNEMIEQYLAMKPAELFQAVVEFQKFDYNSTFRKQYHQEHRRKTDSGYWLVKKTKKEKKRQAKLGGQTYKDDDNDFYDSVLDFDNLTNWAQS